MSRSAWTLWTSGKRQAVRKNCLPHDFLLPYFLFTPTSVAPESTRRLIHSPAMA